MKPNHLSSTNYSQMLPKLNFCHKIMVVAFAATKLSFTSAFILSTPGVTPFLSRLALRSSSSTHLSMSSLSGNLVSVESCIEAHQSKNDAPIFVDASWYLSPEKNGRVDYEAGPRIVGAKFFDIDDVAAKGEILNPKGLPHMMPPKELFEKVMDAIGIERSDHVVIYGKEGCMFTARAWYQLRAMGHPADQVHLMQGGLNEWCDEGGQIETGPKEVISTESLDNSIDAVYLGEEAKGIVSMEDVLATVNNGDDADSIIVDARSAGRFCAEAPEPRKGVRGGHMPGSFNVPATELIDANDSTKIRRSEELQIAFKNAGVDVKTEKRIICSCGSGVMAALISIALEECGRDPSKTVVYDGSWIEWGLDQDTPIDK